VTTPGAHRRTSRRPVEDRRGALELRACLVDPAGTDEHGREILVTPSLEQDVVRLGFCGGESCAGESLGPLELAARADDQSLDGRAQRPTDRAGLDRLRPM
jgi:hypothetical protein